ncbi:hypothetical protein O181_000167 [Austropuccinia psidii MF-1]|uniref:Uncharacterized protein n=1 Tax=Austropuccinia psidii MF-1 TaxID=1389203 RepID=A0A9Q3GBS2_9BASI|nr:hypothetical protein [Austropuccinia psidii MF-1]
MSITGTDVNNALVSRLAIRTLPNKYESLIRILTYGNQYPTIKDIIVNVEKDQALLQTKIEPKDEVALSEDKETRTCFVCGKKGHISRNCRNRGNNNQSSNNKYTQAKLAENEEEEEPNIAFVAINKRGCALIARNQKQTILDSGANNHMFTSKSDFTDLRISSGGVQIGQEGVKIPIKGRGKVIKISNNNKIVFNNALYVPDLPYNLISLSKIWKGKGDLERLQNNKFQVVQNKKKIFNGNIKNGLLHINFDNNNTFVSEHKRLGHGGKSYNCEACKMVKSTQILFNGKIERPNQPLDEISVYLMGPITPISLGGANKQDAKHELEKVILQAENILEKQVKRIICDGGKEFVKVFCEERGIQLTITTPYTPQHNGIVERINRMLMDKVRTLMIESGVKKELWAELTNTANFLLVRVSENEQSPFEKLFNRKPDLSRIKRFGCRAFVTNNNYKRKLDERAHKGILIGYEPDFGIYQILLEDTGKIIWSRDVRFNEDEIPFKNKKDNKNNINQENTIEEEIEPIRQEEIELGQPDINVQEENREPLWIRLRIPRPQEHESTQNNEGTSNIQKKTKKPRWEWELYTKAPKDINSDILQENIIERQSRNNRALVANVGEMASKEKDEAFSKNDYTTVTAMNANTELDEGNPESLKEAQRRPDWAKWKQAYFTELDCISDQNVFKIIPRQEIPKEKTLINTRWVFTKKFDQNGNLQRYKARCVARGFKQKSGIDYQETFSPTGRLSTLRFLISHSAQTEQQIRQADFVTAYLNSELNEEESVFSSPPEGFCEWIRESKPETYEEKRTKDFMKNPTEYVLKLKKSLYGLTQAAQSWYQTLKNWLINFGFIPSNADPCLFIRGRTILFAWVDDILIVGNDSNQVINGLKEQLKIKDLGPASHLLGIRIIRDRLDHITINQTHYIEELLKKYNMEDCKTTSTSMQSNIKLEPSKDEEAKEFKKLNLDYRASVGSLNYLTQCTQPDISYVVGHLSQFLEKPNITHWNCFKRILRYLKGTKDLGINYHKSDNDNIIGYSDTSWEEDLNRRSWSGYVFMYEEVIVSWRSKKLGGVSASSTEAEFRAYLAAFHEAKWLALIQSEINNENPRNLKVYSDNQGAISRAKNPIYHSRTKHIEVHYNSIRDSIENNEVLLEYLPTEELLADCTTKALDRNKNEYFNRKMGLRKQTSTVVNIAEAFTELSQSRGRVRGTIVKSQLLEKLINEHEKLINKDVKILDELIGYKNCRDISIERKYKSRTKRKALTNDTEKHKRRRKHQLLDVKYLVDYKRIRDRKRTIREYK